MISFKRLLKFGLTSALAGIAVASVTAVMFSPSDGGEASSHREAPLISQDPLADTTDVYAFIAPDAPDKLTLVGNWIPLEEPSGGPNFYNFGDDVWYEFAIDNDGDAKPDIVYAFRFYTEIVDKTTFLYATGPITSLDDPNFNIRQLYDVYRRDGNSGYKKIASNLRTPPNNIGPVSTPNYDAVANSAIYDLPGGGKVFAGQRDDPFFVDLGAVFDLASIRVLPGNNGGGIDGVGGFNTNSIVLQVPIASVTDCECDPATAPAVTSGETLGTLGDNRTPRSSRTARATPTASPEPEPETDTRGIIGVWSDTYRGKVRVIRKDGSQDNFGKFRQVSRLGNPLVNEVVIPLEAKDKFNASDPEDDGQFLDYVLNSDLAEKLNIVYNGVVKPIPETGRQDLVTVFLTGIPGLNQPDDVVASEQLRLNLAIKPAACGAPKRLGVIAGDNCGFPNGRRLADDVTDVEIRAVACGYGFDFPPCVDSAPNNALGDGVDANDKAFLTSFPYVAAPHSGFTHAHHTGTVVPVYAGLAGSGVTLVLLAVGAIIFAGMRRRRAVVEDDAA